MAVIDLVCLIAFYVDIVEYHRRVTMIMIGALD
jgi:hypothetical protein